jgi:hypothetical protein
LGEYRLTKKELQSIIKIFISQLRSLVGIQDIDVKGLVIFIIIVKWIYSLIVHS